MFEIHRTWTGTQWTFPWPVQGQYCGENLFSRTRCLCSVYFRYNSLYFVLGSLLQVKTVEKFFFSCTCCSCTVATIVFILFSKVSCNSDQWKFFCSAHALSESSLFSIQVLIKVLLLLVTTTASYLLTYFHSNLVTNYYYHYYYYYHYK